jgi:isopentenyl-diphosphate delta-isomerase
LNNEIILVDLLDNEIGHCSKEQAHKEKKLHRAFSVFLHGEKGLLIQRRAFDKYHSGGLWANTCCSHPRYGEDTYVAAQRRLKEECGIVCDLTEISSFVYYRAFPDGLAEYEYDHIFVGEYNGKSNFDQQEISEMRWVSLQELQTEMLVSPEQFAAWFMIAAPQVFIHLNNL